MFVPQLRILFPKTWAGDQFADLYPQCGRSCKAWSEAYLRHRAILDPLAAKYRTEERANRRAQAIYRDESTPEGQEGAVSGTKRVRKSGDDEEYTPFKRSKVT